MTPTTAELIAWCNDQIIKHDELISPKYLKNLRAIKRKLEAGEKLATVVHYMTDNIPMTKNYIRQALADWEHK